MNKLIALALISSLSITGTAIAKDLGGGGGQGGQGSQGAGDNGPDRATSTIEEVDVSRGPSRKPLYTPPKKVEFCHIGGEIAASDNECSHYSR